MAYLTCVSRSAWSIVDVRSRLKLSVASVVLLLSQQSFAAQPSSCKPEGILRVAQGTEMTTVDPAKSYATGADVSFLPQVFDALIMQGPDGILAPGLATSWKILDDGKRIEFELRKGVKFHNGDEFTADDVKFSWDRISNPDTKWNPLSTVYPTLKSVDVIDKYRVGFNFSAFDALFLTYGAGRLWIMPRDYFNSVAKSFADSKGFTDKPVGTGPFKFVEWSRKNHWSIEAFEDYWGGSPCIKTAIIRIVPDELTRISMLKAGEVDIVQGVPPSLIADLKQTRNVHVEIVPTLTKVWLDTNDTEDAPWAKPEVRLAMNYAIDRKTIIERLLNGLGDEVVGTAKNSIGYNPDLKPFPYDPKKAKELLAKAGYPDGFEIDLWGILGGRIPNASEVLDAISGYLREVGIRANVKPQEYATWAARVNKVRAGGPKFTGMMIFFNPSYDSLNRLRFHQLSTGSQAFKKDADIDAMILKSQSIVNQDERDRYLQEVWKVIHERAQNIDLYQQNVAFGVQNKVDWKAWKNYDYVAPATARFVK